MVASAIHSAPNKRMVIDNLVSIDWIVPSSLNPRKHFDPDKLQELAESIARIGLLEPLVARYLNADNTFEHPRYELIAGERRWRASKLAGLTELPVRNLGKVDDKTALEMALVENLQRADLDPIEEAEGYASLNRVVGLKQSAIAAAVNRSQPTIANRMRLLELPADVQERIRKGELSPSHGVALAKFAGFPAIASRLAELAVDNHWTSANLEPSLPAAYALGSEGLATTIRSWNFDSTICKTACPFQAYRSPERYGDPYCLRPDHYAELIRQHDEARELAMRHDEEERRAVLAEKDPVAAAALPAIDDIPNVDDWYKSGMTDVGKAPTGCSAECPCFVQVMHYHRLTDACKDPKRLERLRRADTIAANKARKAEVKELRAQLTTRLANLAVLGPSEWLIISTQALSQPVETHRVSPEWHRLNGETAKTMTLHSTTIGSLDNMTAAQGLTGVAKLVVGAILGGELDAYHEGLRCDAHLTKWYLGEETNV